MLSETWLTTQASSFVRAFTETGSIPTGTSAISAGVEGCVRSKTDSRASGVLTANNRVPSGEILTGLVCDPSKFTNALWGAVLCVATILGRKAAARIIIPITSLADFMITLLIDSCLRQDTFIPRTVRHES